ncbi:translation initiation factor IF-2-like [Ursus maritimus]|uniref:Translation initiation factor IF-2-like n=1 Tax=Ursus maritimus TaxID=29073 RepID=A0A8M1FGH4_URSMA|nr:translation initiation factor IF-2-like [Ursus maritimus]
MIVVTKFTLAVHLSRGGFLQEDNPGHRATTPGSWGRGPYFFALRSGGKSPPRLPSRERPGREEAPLHFPSPSPNPGARTCRAEPVGSAPPSPTPAGRERPPDTHLGPRGGRGPSRATRPRSPCGRQRAHAASTAAARTRRHCPCCGASARGLPRPHRAGALPAAPFRLPRTILWRLRAAQRSRPLTARVRRAAQQHPPLGLFSCSPLPRTGERAGNPFGRALESLRKASRGTAARTVRDGPTDWHAVLCTRTRSALSRPGAEWSRVGCPPARPPPAARCHVLAVAAPSD